MLLTCCRARALACALIFSRSIAVVFSVRTDFWYEKDRLARGLNKVQVNYIRGQKVRAKKYHFIWVVMEINAFSVSYDRIDLINNHAR